MPIARPNLQKRAELKTTFKQFFVEFVVYAVLVTAYYLLVLHFLGNGLKRLYDHDRTFYAGVALALIVGQGLLLEVFTRLLLGWIKPRTEEE